MVLLRWLSSWWFQPLWKICSSKLDHFPKDRGENKKYVKPPPSGVWLVGWLVGWLWFCWLGCGCGCLKPLRVCHERCQDAAFIRWSFMQPWDPQMVEGKIRDAKLPSISKVDCHSMVVSGSPKRWDRWHSPSPNWQYIPLIYHLYIAFWGVICYLPPFRGTRNNHWVIASYPPAN